MNRNAIVTVATRNYLHFALAMIKSANEHHSDTDFFICLADHPLQPLDMSTADVEVFHASDLAIPNWARFTFQYDPFELACALKPFAIQHLLDRGYEKIVYLDADMRVYGRLNAVFLGLEQHSIVMTPHLLRPFPQDGGAPGEELFLAAGPFNAGFLAIRDDAIGQNFVRWWSERLLSNCYKDMANSMFVDQKWLSLVPGLFENVLILRDPGYNTGHWTLPQFTLGIDSSGVPTIGERPIVLFHFSNLSPNASNEFANCQTRMTLDAMPILKQLVTEYHSAIHACNELQFDTWGCVYTCLSDGTKIHPAWREAIRRNHPLLEDATNPFDVEATPQLKSKYVALERQAYKWRRDWRLKGTNSSPQNEAKSLDRHLKTFLSRIGLRKKAA